MKAVHVLVAVIALVIGIGVGGLGPRSEIRSLRAKLEQAGECQNGALGSEIANVFRGRPWGEPTGRRVIPPPDAGPPEPTAPDTDGPPPMKAPADPEGFRVQWTGSADDEAIADLGEGLALAREAMALRLDQAREALMQDARPSAEQVARFDEAMAAMNQDLVGLAHALVDQIASGEPSRRDTMLYAAETLDVLLTAEDNLRGVFTEDQLASMQEASLDPLSYVEPTLLDVLAELDR